MVSVPRLTWVFFSAALLLSLVAATCTAWADGPAYGFLGAIGFSCEADGMKPNARVLCVERLADGSMSSRGNLAVPVVGESVVFLDNNREVARGMVTASYEPSVENGECALLSTNTVWRSSSSVPPLCVSKSLFERRRYTTQKLDTAVGTGESALKAVLVTLRRQGVDLATLDSLRLTGLTPAPRGPGRVVWLVEVSGRVKPPPRPSVRYSSHKYKVHCIVAADSGHECTVVGAGLYWGGTNDSDPVSELRAYYKSKGLPHLYLPGLRGDDAGTRKLDWVDVDGDGVAEVVLWYTFCEGTGSAVLRLESGRWTVKAQDAYTY